jgi:hypothetical protein
MFKNVRRQKEVQKIENKLLDRSASDLEEIDTTNDLL